MLRRLKRFVIFVILLVIAGAVGLYLLINSLTKTAVEESLSFILQVDVTLDKAKVSLFSGDIELQGLKVANPAGFEAPESFSCDQIKLKADLKSLRSDAPRIEIITITKPKITLEQDGLNLNLRKLIDSASRFDSGEVKPEEKDQAEKTNKKLQVGLILIEGSSVEVVAPLINKGAQIPLPNITIKDLGKTNEKVTLAQSIVRLLKEILAKAFELGKDILPIDFKELMLKVDGLTGMLGQGFTYATDTLKSGAQSAGGILKDPGASLDKAAEGLKDGAGAVVDGLSDTASDAGEGLKEGAKSLTGGLKGLFDKKEEEKK